MDWVIFGDDWGAHPSTTQHLAANLPGENRLIWVDSIGMRTPKLNIGDLKRIASKLRGFVSAKQDLKIYSSCMKGFERIKPKIAPWHMNPLIAHLNGRMLGDAIRQKREQLNMDLPVLMSSTPVVVNYLSSLPYRKLIYLRLDDYEHLPGVEPKLIRATEPEMYRRANAVVATAQALLPTGEFASKAHYLPQGVNWEHFAQAALQPSRKKILGFFGVVAPWLDFDLIRNVARAAPDWTLEFIGKIEHLPTDVAELPNARFLPPVAFADLPASMTQWSAAWIPFEVSRLTKAVNPLKAREYLAAGMPTHCTPLPEMIPLRDQIMISSDPHAIVDWLNHTMVEDSIDKRRERRELVRGDSWSQRSKQLMDIVGHC